MQPSQQTSLTFVPYNPQRSRAQYSPNDQTKHQRQAHAAPINPPHSAYHPFLGPSGQRLEHILHPPPPMPMMNDPSVLAYHYPPAPVAPPPPQVVADQPLPYNMVSTVQQGNATIYGFTPMQRRPGYAPPHPFLIYQPPAAVSHPLPLPPPPVAAPKFELPVAPPLSSVLPEPPRPVPASGPGAEPPIAAPPAPLAAAGGVPPIAPAAAAPLPPPSLPGPSLSPTASGPPPSSLVAPAPAPPPPEQPSPVAAVIATPVPLAPPPAAASTPHPAAVLPPAPPSVPASAPPAAAAPKQKGTEAGDNGALLVGDFDHRDEQARTWHPKHLALYPTALHVTNPAQAKGRNKPLIIEITPSLVVMRDEFKTKKCLYLRNDDGEYMFAAPGPQVKEWVELLTLLVAERTVRTSQQDEPKPRASREAKRKALSSPAAASPKPAPSPRSTTTAAVASAPPPAPAPVVPAAPKEGAEEGDSSEEPRRIPQRALRARPSPAASEAAKPVPNSARAKAAAAEPEAPRPTKRRQAPGADDGAAEPSRVPPPADNSDASSELQQRSLRRRSFSTPENKAGKQQPAARRRAEDKTAGPQEDRQEQSPVAADTADPWARYPKRVRLTPAEAEAVKGSEGRRNAPRRPPARPVSYEEDSKDEEDEQEEDQEQEPQPAADEAMQTEAPTQAEAIEPIERTARRKAWEVDENLSEIMQTPGPVTRGALKKAISPIGPTGPEPAEGTSPSPKKARGRKKREFRRVTSTAIAVKLLPGILERVMQSLPQENILSYDIYEIQNLIVVNSLDEETFSPEDPTVADKITQAVIDTVKSDTTNKYIKGARKGRLDLSVIGEQDLAVLQRYNELMNSEEMKELRKAYRHGGMYRRVWKEQELKRFEEALLLFPSGPGSTKKIANYVGGGVTQNHVAFLKSQRRKKMRRLGIKGPEARERGMEALAAMNFKPGNVDLDNPETLIGKRVRVWFHNLKRYYEGKILSYDYGRREFALDWGNGEVSSTELAKQHLTLLPSNPDRWHFVETEEPREAPAEGSSDSGVDNNEQLVEDNKPADQPEKEGVEK